MVHKEQVISGQFLNLNFPSANPTLWNGLMVITRNTSHIEMCTLSSTNFEALYYRLLAFIAKCDQLHRRLSTLAKL